MNTNHKSNIALTHAIDYFVNKDYHIFLPFGETGSDVDLIVSPDGITMMRVQCKYTQSQWVNNRKANINSHIIWYVPLNVGFGKLKQKAKYTENSFDLLFITTPEDNYLIEWKQYCITRGRIPCRLRLGKHSNIYKI